MIFRWIEATSEPQGPSGCSGRVAGHTLRKVHSSNWKAGLGARSLTQRRGKQPSHCNLRTKFPEQDWPRPQATEGPSVQTFWLLT